MYESTYILAAVISRRGEVGPTSWGNIFFSTLTAVNLVNFSSCYFSIQSRSKSIKNFSDKLKFFFVYPLDTLVLFVVCNFFAPTPSNPKLTLLTYYYTVVTLVSVIFYESRTASSSSEWSKFVAYGLMWYTLCVPMWNRYTDVHYYQTFDELFYVMPQLS